MSPAVLGLGSNLGDRRAHLAAATRELRALGLPILACSSLYETEPLHYLDQGWFLNAAVVVDPPSDPRALLRTCQAVEAALGRQRDVPMGPRTADVDILLLGDLVLAEPDLEVPHPRLLDRLFALIPLLDLVPDARDPRTDRPLAEARHALLGVPGQAVRRVGGPGDWEGGPISTWP